MNRSWLKNLIPTIWDSVKFVIAPPICVFCAKIIDTNEWGSEHICPFCYEKLPKPISYEKIIEHINKNFGSENNPFNFAFSLFDSSENHKYLELIHLFKYSKFRNLGNFLGRHLAEEILTSTRLLKVEFDAVVPVPIHKAKMRERGFNQSEIIAKEIARKLRLPILNIIYRNRYTETQTNLNFEQRKKNVSEAFSLNSSKDKIIDKSFLLVDDVITTGSTLVNCGKLLKENKAKQLAFAVITTA